MGNINNKYINRELSWLEFNARVLEEAEDESNPLLERLKFISIVSSNLDEFFMKRVASLADQVKAGYTKKDPSGLTPAKQLEKISLLNHELVSRQYKCFSSSLVKELNENKIFFLKIKELSDKQKEYIERLYWKQIYPVITPLIIDQSRAFPLIKNESLNIGLLLKGLEEEGEQVFATVQIPELLGRYIQLPGDKNLRQFVLLEDIIKKYIYTLFRGHEVLTMGCYRITRNADLSLDEEGAEDLLKEIEQSLKMRKWGAVIRLEMERNMDPGLFKILRDEMDIPAYGIYETPGPIDLKYLMNLCSLPDYDELRYPEFTPHPTNYFKDKDMFKVLEKKDIILHHPYESFDPIVDIIHKAAVDPDVLAIKQTLYRVSGNSPIIDSLARAAENGKQVTVLLELKARFDEENNIISSRKLEKAGCNVIYGLVGLKTHCKILLIVRKEKDGIKRYVHMGTGNYNDVTARLYTDIGLLTSNPYIGSDVSAIFNMITGYSKITDLFKTEIAPTGLRKKFNALIIQETENARMNRDARIIAKMNSLVDKDIIDKLYEASQAGVEIDLIVRGICCLRPGVMGLSENIRVYSIVGRFLEHSRIFYFYNDGNELYFLSSADWMPRNLNRRVELLFPVRGKKNKKRIKKILEVFLSDNVKTRILNKNGKYTRLQPGRGQKKLNCHDYFIELAQKRFKSNKNIEDIKEFQPVESRS